MCHHKTEDKRKKEKEKRKKDPSRNFGFRFGIFKRLFSWRPQHDIVAMVLRCSGRPQDRAVKMLERGSRSQSLSFTLAAEFHR